MPAVKFRTLIVGAVAGAAFLLAGASGASASPTHAASAAKPVVTASPDASCEPGYYTIKDGYGKYLTGEGVNNPVETTTDTNYCWRTQPDYVWGPIKNEAGQVLRWDAAAGEVVLAPSYATVTYEEWQANPTLGATAYVNLWEFDTTDGLAGLLYAIHNSGSSLLSAAGVNTTAQSLWYKGS